MGCRTPKNNPKVAMSMCFEENSCDEESQEEDGVEDSEDDNDFFAQATGKQPIKKKD
jgi:hypothetical protein